MRPVRQAGAATLCAVLASMTACSSKATESTHPNTTTYAAQVAERQRATVAYAERLAGQTPQVDGETALVTKPPKNLQRPNERIGVSNLVVRARYWTAPGTPDSVYDALTNHPVAGLRLSGNGKPSSSSDGAPGRGFAHFDPTSPPAFIDSSELYVEMEPGANGQTVIAAFAEVSAHPIRTAAETIPETDTQVTITRARIQRPTGPIDSVALNGQESAAFVHAFNASPVRAPGVCIGGIGPSFGYRIAMASGDRTWHVTYPGGANCGGFGVVLGKQSLPDLEATSAIRHLINNDYLDGKGFVEGELGAVGGPKGAIRQNYRGTVLAVRNGRVIARAPAEGQMGSFELIVPPGHYTLTAHSPDYNDGHGVCHGYKPVNVRAGGSAFTYVTCQLR